MDFAFNFLFIETWEIISLERNSDSLDFILEELVCRSGNHLNLDGSSVWAPEDIDDLVSCSIIREDHVVIKNAESGLILRKAFHEIFESFFSRTNLFNGYVFVISSGSKDHVSVLLFHAHFLISSQAIVWDGQTQIHFSLIIIILCVIFFSIKFPFFLFIFNITPKSSA